LEIEEALLANRWRFAMDGDDSPDYQDMIFADRSDNIAKPSALYCGCDNDEGGAHFHEKSDPRNGWRKSGFGDHRLRAS